MERPYSMRPGAQVDLSDGVRTVKLCDVDQQAGLNAVALTKRQPFEDTSAGRIFAPQWLPYVGEVGEESGYQRPGHDLGGAPAANSIRLGTW